MHKLLHRFQIIVRVRTLGLLGCFRAATQQHLRLVHVFAIGACLALAPPARAGFIDNVNGSANPSSNATNEINGDAIGWYYTPSFSYSLSGISTFFAPALTTSLVTPQIEVQIQSERPVNGGVLLAQGGFQANSINGGVEGATFSPVLLVAGHTYFVDFTNLQGMGSNFGSWQNDQNGIPHPSAGATLNLGVWYVDSNNGFSTVRTDAYDTASDGSHVSPPEPILNFTGALVPEPSSWVLLTAGGLALLVRVAKRRQGKGPPQVGG
jgi:hypothetical protein